MITLIEQNRKHSRATLRILRLRRDHIWPEDGMRYGKFIFSESLNSTDNPAQKTGIFTTAKQIYLIGPEFSTIKSKKGKHGTTMMHSQKLLSRLSKNFVPQGLVVFQG
jgi:hypothetical protein